MNAYIPYSIIVLLLLLLASSIAGLFHRRKGVTFLINTSLFALIAIASIASMIYGTTYTVAGVINFSAFSELFIALFSVSLLLISILAYRYSGNHDTFSFLLALSFTGMFFISTASSLLEILLGFEMMALPSVFMIISEGRSTLEAGIKLFFLGVVSITVLVFAISLIYSYNPSLSLSSMQPLQGTIPYLLVLAIILFIASLGVETALFPFNLWVPDVYQGAPGFITALLAGVNKKVAFVALLEILFIVLIPFSGTFTPVLVLLSILTMFFGNLAAMVQENVKRMFAYSSISQAGYILVGMAAAGSLGITASIFQIITHAFMIIGAFSVVMWLESRNMHTVDDYSGLFRSNGFAAVSLTLLMLSMAGIPPLMGFYGKFLLFSSAISSKLLYLAVIGIVNSFISIYYYGRLINSMFVKKEKRKEKMDFSVIAVVSVTLAVVVLFGIYPQPVLHLASLASAALLPK